MSESLPADQSRPAPQGLSAKDTDTSKIHGPDVRTHSIIREDPSVADTADFVATREHIPLSFKTLGDYEILEAIARGGMGVVYKARQIKLNRLVALKMIRSGELAEPEQIKRFYAEAAAAAKLDHPAIVPVYEVGEVAGQHFFSMAFIQGQSLNERVKSAGALPPKVAARMLQTVAQAVQYAHDQGIVHRDIKPHNILLDQNEQPHVADFGLAKHVQTASDMTTTGQILGTPSYMSPEQAGAKADEIGKATDIYSLGATLYCLLTGRPPMQASSVPETIRQVQFVDPAPLRQLNPEIPRDLETICLKCLRKEPEKRYASADDLAQDLERWLNNRPILARPTGFIERTSLWCWRNPVVAALLAFIAVSLIGGSGLAVVAAVVFKRNADEIATANESLQESNHQSEVRRVAAEERRKLVQTHLYAADLNHFMRLLESGRFDQVYETLSVTRPEKTGDELRGWEWYHLYDLAYSERLRFERHPAEITACAMSPDERTMASGDKEGNLLLWDASSGAIKERMKPFSAAVLKLAFSPSGGKLAVGGADSSVVIVDVSTGKPQHTIQEHVLGVHALAFGPTDELLATASADGTVKVFSAADGAWKSQTLLGHTRVIRNVWFDQAGQRLASISEDKTLRFWAIRDEQWQADGVVKDLPSNTAVSPDLKQAAYWRDQKSADPVPDGIAVVDLPSKKVVVHLPGYDTDVRDMSFGQNNDTLAVADDQGDVVVWEFPQKPPLRIVARPIARHHGAAQSILLSSTGAWMISICSDRALKLWPAQDDFRVRFQGHRHDTSAVAFSLNGTLIASADFFGDVRLWNRATGELIHSLGKRFYWAGPPGDPDTAAQAAGITEFNRKHVSAVRISGERERWIWVFEGHAGQVDGVQFSPDGKILASAGSDGKVWLWDTATGTAVDVLLHPQPISSLVFSPDGKWLVTGSWDDRVRIWDVEQRKEQFVLEGHAENVNAVALDNDGKTIASGGADGVVRLWELRTGKLLRELPGHENEVEALAFSPDGKVLATGGSDQVIRVWDLGDASLRYELRGHRNEVTSLLFHPTDYRLFSASRAAKDAKVRVWDLSIGREIVALSAPGTDVQALAMDAGGQCLAVTADDSLVLWEASKKGHAPPAKVAPADMKDVEKPQADLTPAKVLGFYRRPELMRAINNTRNPIRPASPDHELLVLVVSVPNKFLYLTSEQYELLKTRAKATKKQPPGPLHSILHFDPVRFKLLRRDAPATTAIAIAPLEFAFSAGFKEGDMRVSGTTSAPPADRMLMGVVWDVPRGTERNLELQFDKWEPVSVPRIELNDYRLDSRE